MLHSMPYFNRDASDRNKQPTIIISAVSLLKTPKTYNITIKTMWNNKNQLFATVTTDVKYLSNIKTSVQG